MDEARTEPPPMSPQAALLRRVLFVGAWSVLVVVVLSKIGAYSSLARRDATIARVQQIEKALARYSIDNCGAVPSTVQGLQALRLKPRIRPIPPNWHGPYLSSDEMLNDDWGRPFQYVAPGGLEPDIKGVEPIARAFDLWSLGADGREGGTGTDASIRSWEAPTGAP